MNRGSISAPTFRKHLFSHLLPHPLSLSLLFYWLSLCSYTILDNLIDWHGRRFVNTLNEVICNIMNFLSAWSYCVILSSKSFAVQWWNHHIISKVIMIWWVSLSSYCEKEVEGLPKLWKEHSTLTLFMGFRSVGYTVSQLILCLVVSCLNNVL